MSAADSLATTVLELQRRNAELLKALELVWSMFDDKRIVRNIENDHKPDWALKMLQFTQDLKTIHEAMQHSQGRG